MRIIFDMQSAQTAQSGKRGVGRYTRHFAKALVERAGSDEIILALNGAFADSARELRSELLPFAGHDHIRTWSSHDFGQALYPQPVDLRQSNRVIRDNFLGSLEPDFLFHSGLFEGFDDFAQTGVADPGGNIPNGSMLHDLNPLKFPDLLAHPQVRSWYEGKLDDLRKAKLLFTMSEAVRQDAINLLELPAERIVTIGTGVAPAFLKPALDGAQRCTLLDRFKLSKPFILYYGGFDRHKNVGRLVEAAALTMRRLGKRFGIVLAGPIGDAQRLELERIALLSGLALDELQFPGFVADDDLPGLLNSCDVFVYPSLGEGFGLPVLEAMSAGAPVLCADNSSLPEVMGLADAMFDAEDPVSMAEKLFRVLSDAQFASALRMHGRRRAELFNWHDTADRALEAIRFHAQKAAVKQRTASVFTLAASTLAVRPHGDAENREIMHLAYNRPSEGPGRLLIDVTYQNGGTPGSGIARVAARICQTLGDTAPGGLAIVPVAAVPDQPQFKVARNFIAAAGLESRNLPETDILSLRHGEVFLGLDLNHHLRPQMPFIDRLQKLGGKSFAVVYDLLPLQRPDWFPHVIRAGHEDWIRQVTLFDGLICISNAVADDLKVFRQTLPEQHQRSQIGVFHLGSDLTAQPEGDVPPALLVRPTVMMVSVVYARKGHMQTLQAFEQLWASGLDANIVFAGRRGWGADEFFEAIENHPERDKRLFWFDGPDDGLLQRLYETCSGVLVASEGEGFGLPLVEALARHKPVLARDIPVLREVAGDRVRYFSGLNPEDLAQALASWIHDIRAGSALVDPEYKPLSWKQSAQQLLRAMEIVK